MTKNILIIEDEPIMRNILKNTLKKAGHETTIVEDGIKGIAAINEGDFDIIVTDIILPQGDGFKVLKWAKERRPDSSVILITGHGKVKDAVEAMKLGASDYLTKPFSMEDLLLRIDKIIEFQELKRDYTRLQKECETIFGVERILGVSPHFKRKPGKFELANHGTLFLDEIGDLPQSVQVKLLRVLQEREFERIGGTETIKVDVRIICATNRDLEKEAKEGKFREDLFYRLKVIPVVLPPLRERKEDIPLLTNHFIKHYSKKMNKKVTHFSDEAMDYLMDYNFPGNVRELENVVERTIALCPNQVIEKEYLPSTVLQNPKKKPQERLGPLQDRMGDFEKNYIIDVLKKAKGNKTKAAEILNISRKNLWEKMRKYNLLGASEDNA
ncbi:MAG: sigma-54-dependent Fis family transcriptional regulator [Nitrospirae bacterium]|nr:sigma-54-dependent Fis family transcriptional regulator [Nitrospirota bacterium]